MDYEVKPIQATLYRVKFGRRHKTFRYQVRILPWIVKQIMLDVFQREYNKTGDYVKHEPPDGYERETNVFRENWDICKPNAIQYAKEHGIEGLEAWLLEWLENEAM